MFLLDLDGLQDLRPLRCSGGLQGQLVEHHEPDAVDEGDSNLADCGDFNIHPVGGAHGKPAEPADRVLVPRGDGGEGGEGGH